MPLSKGFLTRKSIISKPQIISGIIIWFIYAYILYQVLNLMRGILWSLTGIFLYTRQHPLLLSGEENFWYNLFYAALASSIAFMWAVNHVLRQENKASFNRNRQYIRRAINETGFVSWAALFWFAKVAGTFGIFYLSFPFQEDIDFLKDLPLFLILLPSVLLLSTWPQLIRIFGQYSFKKLLYIITIFLAMSLFYSMNFMDYNSIINEKLIKKSIILQYKLDVPTAKGYKENDGYWRTISADLFVVRDTVNDKPPIIFINEINNRIDYLKDLNYALFIEKQTLNEFERNHFFVNLHIDKNISMKFVDALVYQLRKGYYYRMHYSTEVKFSKYPSTYIYFNGLGLNVPYQPYFYPEFESFLDSAEKLDLTNYKIKLDKSWMYRSFTKEEKQKTITKYIYKNKVLLNGKEFSDEKLKSLIYRFLAKHPKEGVIILEKEPDITFGRYIKYLDLINTQLYKLRNEYSMKHFNKPYDQLYYYKYKEKVIEAYPYPIMEWSQEEKRLKRLIKKSKEIRSKK